MPRLLRIGRIEAKPKRIYKPAGFFMTVRLGQPEQEALLDLIEHIEKGHIVPQRYYRRGVDVSADELLVRHGIMHLHLGRPDTPELLFLSQYDTHVYLIGVTGHDPFRDRPPGSTLARRILPGRSRWEQAVEKDAEAAAEAKRQIVRQSLKRRLPESEP